MDYNRLEQMADELRQTAKQLRAGELTVDPIESAKIFENIASEFDAIGMECRKLNGTVGHRNVRKALIAAKPYLVMEPTVLRECQ